jgi:RND family efflux transporter MFP subunit
MYLSKIKTVAALVLVLGVLLAGGILSRHALEAAPQQEANQDKLAKPDDAPKPGQEVKKGPVVVQVTTPLPGGLERMTTTTGTVRAMGESKLFASVSGTLKNQTVDIGDRVKRGQLLAEIDAPLLALEVKQAEVAVKQAKALVQEAAARCDQARAEVEVAKTVVREKAAAAAVNVGGTGLAIAEADLKVRESKVAQTEAALETARAGLETAELGLEKAPYSLGLTRILAPFDGVVTQRNHLPGETLRTADQAERQPLLTVTRIDSVSVVLDVGGWDVPLTEVGLPVDLRIDVLPNERFAGYKVSRIGVVEDEKTGMRVEIDVPNPKGLLRPGMWARATIHLGKGPADALRIPRSALLRLGDDKYGVYVVRDGKAHRTPIELSPDRGGSQVEVLSGLKRTDRVVIDPKGLNGDVVPVEVKKETNNED